MQYDRGNLTRAYTATQGGMSVRMAARRYSVPESTLRDRTRGIVDIDAIPGHVTLLTANEEQKLVAHISYLADIGYGYNKSEIQYMASDYAHSLGKEVPATEKLSNCWFYGFLKRWPELKVVKPQKLSISRAKSASSEVLANYYTELGNILSANNLTNKPERIYNVDETGISTEHLPPKIVCNVGTNPQAVTSPRSSTVTCIAAGNALGNSVPPYYIFPGVRWNDSFLEGAATGTAGAMSKSGWSNSEVFQNYLNNHFLRYSTIPSGSPTEPTLVLYDGHRSHVSLTLTDWARRNNVILFVLPPHTSHLTQHLDVGIFGPFKAMYYKECQDHMKHHPGLTITKYEVAQQTAKPYMKSVTAENLTSAFRKTGIYPFNNQTDFQVAPATIYSNETPETKETMRDNEIDKSNDNPGENENQDNTDNQADQQQSDEQQPEVSVAPSDPQSKPADFFQARTITSVVKAKLKRKFVPPFLAGSLHKKSVIDILQEQATKKLKTVSKSSKSKPVSKPKLTKSNVTKKQPVSKTVSPSSTMSKKAKGKTSKTPAVISEPLPGTSGLNKQGGAINLEPAEDTESDYSLDDDQVKCCVCDLWEPEALKRMADVTFVEWAECDFCKHLTHLTFCSAVRQVAEGSEFRCPHCLPQVQ